MCVHQGPGGQDHKALKNEVLPYEPYPQHAVLWTKEAPG